MTDSNKRTALSGIQRTACEVWSRVTGYLRPVKTWNKGKMSEFVERKVYKINSKEDKD